MKDAKLHMASAFWGPRRETPAVLAARFLKLLDRHRQDALRLIDLILA